MKMIARIIALSFSLLSISHAAQSAFSLKGDKIFLIPMEGFGKLYVIDTATQKSTSVSLGKAFADVSIDSIAVSPKNEVLFAAKGSLWKWNESGSAPQKITDFEDDCRVLDISCSHGTLSAPEGTIFALIEIDDAEEASLLAMLPGKKKFSSVFCRRNTPYSAPQTDASGRMFIASNYDLWEVRFIPEEENDPELDRAGTLHGCRIAPLALMNTDIANSGAMIVRGIASCGTSVYAYTQGRHMGAIVRCEAPKTPLYQAEDPDEHPGLAKSFAIMKQALEKSAVLYDGSPCDALSAYQSATQTFVFWRQDLENDRVWMLQKGKDAAIKIGADPQP
jgi:hypothetical protein